MSQLSELGKRIAAFEEQEGLLDLYYKVYKDPGTPEYTVGTRFIGEESEVATISVRLLDPEKSTKRIHFVDIELLCDKEKNITGMKRIAVRHYSNNYTYYELEYNTDEKNADSTATLTKITKHNFDKLGKSTGGNPLDMESLEVTSLNLPAHGLPSQINWIRTAFMYATGIIDEPPKVRNLTATDISRQPVLPVIETASQPV